MVIRADYANENVLVATLSNPNGDGTDATVKQSMLIPVPNGGFYEGTSTTPTTYYTGKTTYVSLGAQQLITTNGIRLYAPS